MATIDLKVQPLSLTLTGDGNPSSFSLQTVTNAGANLTLTGATYGIALVPRGFGFNGPYPGLIIPTVTLITASAGSSALAITVTSPTTGVYSAELVVTPSGGSAQVVALGQVQIV